MVVIFFKASVFQWFSWSLFQEGYIEELSTCFYLDTALLKSSESVLSETEIFNIKMVDTHFKSEQNQLLHLDTKKILSAPLYILLIKNANFDNDFDLMKGDYL